MLLNVFRTSPGDPTSLAPTAVRVDLSPWAGEIVRLRLAQSDNQGPLRAGADNIRFEPIGAGADARIELLDTLEPTSALDLVLHRLTEAEALAALEGFVREEAAADRFTGAVLVAKGGEVLFTEAYGLADRDREILNAVQTRFRIGSMNKMFTAVAILQSYYDYVDEHIYEPAGMTGTGSLPENQTVPDRAVGYTDPSGGSDWRPNTDTLPLPRNLGRRRLLHGRGLRSVRRRPAEPRAAQPGLDGATDHREGGDRSRHQLRVRIRESSRRPGERLGGPRWRRTRHERRSTDLSSVGLRGGRPGKPGSAGRPAGRRLPRRPAAARRIARPTGVLQQGEATSSARTLATRSHFFSKARGPVAETNSARSFTNCSVNLSCSWCPQPRAAKGSRSTRERQQD